MKAYDYEAVIYDSQVYCLGCLPDGVKLDDPLVEPIFTDSEWEFVPTCAECATEHDYVTVLNPPEPAKGKVQLGRVMTKRKFEIWSNTTQSGDDVRHGDYLPMIDGYRPGAFLCKSYEGEDTLPMEEAAALEELFVRFNQDDRPNGRIAHSLSIGDVVVLDGKPWTVESLGFAALHEFNPEGPHPEGWRDRRQAHEEERSHV